jgi:hypothetical protein
MKTDTPSLRLYTPWREVAVPARVSRGLSAMHRKLTENSSEQ